MRKKLYKILLLLVTIYSCNSSESDYIEHGSGLKFKVLKESESKIKINEGDFIELKLKYKTETDSVLFNSEEFGFPFKMQVDKKSHLGGSFEDAIKMMNPGDKYQFIISADSFYLKTKREKLPASALINSNLTFNIQVIRKISTEEINTEKRLLEKQMVEQEKTILLQYLFDNQIQTKPENSGLYYIELKKGNGQNAVSGDIITVHYTGKLINGKIFDSSYNRNEAFSFKLGEEEVIPGWEEGFSYMKKGGKAILIIPSKLAYGQEGFSAIIPPFATLIFEVELLDIKNNK